MVILFTFGNVAIQNNNVYMQVICMEYMRTFCVYEDLLYRFPNAVEINALSCYYNHMHNYRMYK